MRIIQRYFFLHFKENICCDPSLKPSRRDGSNNGSKHIFQRKNMDYYPLIIPFAPSYLEHRDILSGKTTLSVSVTPPHPSHFNGGGKTLYEKNVSFPSQHNPFLIIFL